MIQSSPIWSPTCTGLRHGLAVGHHVDELALRPFEHRARRHHHRVGPRRAGQAHAHELAGLEHAVGVGHLGLGLDRAGVARHPRVGEQQLALARIHAAVGQLHLDRERARAAAAAAGPRPLRCATSSGRCRRCRSAPSIGSVCVSVVSSVPGPATSVPSLTCERPAAPDERCLDLGVAEVQRGLGAARLRALEVGARHLLGRRRIVVFALAHRARLPQRLQACKRARGSAPAWLRRRPRRRRRD